MKEEAQLTEHRPLVTQAIRLLPGRYKEEFARALLTARETYDLLTRWLEQSSRMLRIYCPEQVAQQGKNDPKKKGGTGNTGIYNTTNESSNESNNGSDNKRKAR